MRTHTAFAALMIVAASLFQVPAFAEPAQRAELRLRVVNDRNVALAGAAVTIYTLDGNPGVTVTADADGVATFPAVSVGLTQVVAKASSFTPYIDKMTLQAGENARTLTLHSTQSES